MSSNTQSGATLSHVREFWETHINNEYYTDKERGTAAYFDEIERKRYRWHYHLRELFESLRGSSGRLLEVGCGIGVDSVQLALCGFDVTGVDLTDSAIEVARQHARMRGLSIVFRAGNGERLDFGDETFEAVYSFGVLHHTPDIRAAVAEIYRVLKPGGKAYVMLYHRNSLVNLVHWLFHLPYESPRDLKDECPVVYTFTRKAAAQLFQHFTRVQVASDYPFTYGFRFLASWIPRPVHKLLGRWLGWHLMVSATR